MLKCKVHPKYLAKRKPRAACEACWRIWIHENDTNTQDAKIFQLRAKIADAGDRRDWNECDRLEKELEDLLHPQHNSMMVQQWRRELFS